MLALLLAAASSSMPAPLLQFNASRSLTVTWEPSPLDAEATAAEHYYQLQMSVVRDGKTTFHVTRRARAGTHALFWPDLPERADLCFAVATVIGSVDALVANVPLPVYSESTCYSSCTCLGEDAGGGGGDAGGGGGGGGSCASCAFAGAIVGAVLAVAATIFLARRSGVDLCSKQVASGVLRGATGGSYAGVLSDEPAMEMEERLGTRATESGGPSHLAVSQPHHHHTPPLAPPPSAPSIAALIAPPADISGADFELRWSACATRSHSLSGRLPSTSPNAAMSDDAEGCLVRRGFFCVAAGAVGELHKLYFAGALGGGPGGSTDAAWLMIELVLNWGATSVEVTFRCEAPSKLGALADECAALLGPVLRKRLA